MSGPFAQLVTLSEAFTATTTPGYITSRKRRVASPTLFQTDMKTVTMKISALLLTILDSANVQRMITMLLEFTKADATSCIVLIH